MSGILPEQTNMLIASDNPLQISLQQAGDDMKPIPADRLVGVKVTD